LTLPFYHSRLQIVQCLKQLSWMAFAAKNKVVGGAS
jgi:hypothetical protein